MPQQLNDPVLEAFFYGTMWLSVGVGLCLLAARTRGPLLKFQPRSPVPWNAAGAVLACAFVLLIVGTALQNRALPHVDSKANEDAAQNAAQLIGYMAQEVVLVAGALVFIAVYFNASRRDLGLPGKLRELARDMLIGIAAGLAALAPVYLVMGLLSAPDTKSGNELVKMVLGGTPNLIVFFLAAIAAVVVAPICEEITFRLLLQGWLERWEAARLGYCVDRQPQSSTIDEISTLEEKGSTNDPSMIAGNNSSIVIRHSTLESPPAHGVAGLPFSWLPITISSLLFGLAHIGYGPDPVPLFFLALVLGYVYYRTHRIVPCIVCHAVFNSFTMFLLWRMAFHSAQ